jgi:hypothetical protein
MLIGEQKMGAVVRKLEKEEGAGIEKEEDEGETQRRRKGGRKVRGRAGGQKNMKRRNGCERCELLSKTKEAKSSTSETIKNFYFPFFLSSSSHRSLKLNIFSPSFLPF